MGDSNIESRAPHGPSPSAAVLVLKSYSEQALLLRCLVKIESVFETLSIRLDWLGERGIQLKRNFSICPFYMAMELSLQC